MIYIGKYTPLTFFLPNFIEIVNQAFINFISSMMLTFTDFIPDEETKYLLGWVMIFLICLQMLFNIFFVCWFTSKSFKLIYVKYSKRFKRWLKRKRKQFKKKYFPKPVVAKVEPPKKKKPIPKVIANTTLKR